MSQSGEGSMQEDKNLKVNYQAIEDDAFKKNNQNSIIQKKEMQQFLSNSSDKSKEANVVQSEQQQQINISHLQVEQNNNQQIKVQNQNRNLQGQNSSEQFSRQIMKIILIRQQTYNTMECFQLKMKRKLFYVQIMVYQLHGVGLVERQFIKFKSILEKLTKWKFFKLINQLQQGTIE